MHFTVIYINHRDFNQILIKTYLINKILIDISIVL